MFQKTKSGLKTGLVQNAKRRDVVQLFIMVILLQEIVIIVWLCCDLLLPINFQLTAATIRDANHFKYNYTFKIIIRLLKFFYPAINIFRASAGFLFYIAPYSFCNNIFISFVMFFPERFYFIIHQIRDI